MRKHDRIRSMTAMIRKKKVFAVLLGIILVFLMTDYLVGRREATVIKEKEARKERLEKLAFYMIVPDIQDVRAIKNTYGEYEAVIKIENLADEPVYITYPQVITYVQTGTFWTEVPVR
jgi:hypothetical protein